MMELAIWLAVLYMGLELYVVSKFPRMGRVITSKAGVSLVFSLALSYISNVLFPAAGISVLMAAILSTLAIQPIYSARRNWSKIKTRFQNVNILRFWRWYKGLRKVEISNRILRPYHWVTGFRQRRVFDLSSPQP